jgi:type VI protein secretion system component VasF
MSMAAHAVRARIGASHVARTPRARDVVVVTGALVAVAVALLAYLGFFSWMSAGTLIPATDPAPLGS